MNSEQSSVSRPIQSIPNGSVTSPQGFTAAAATCGLKESGAPDLVLVCADRDCTAAGVFTQSQVVAAPVILDRETLAANNARLRGIVANAGIANACTGERGLAAAREMQASAAAALRCNPDQILVLSTGVIGAQLDLERVGAGITAAAGRLSRAGGPDAAAAIMTTDTRPKHLAVQTKLPGGTVTMGGMAKGSGMLHPNMATLLVVLTTDAAVAPDTLHDLLVAAVNRSFNRVSIDGDTSTNDTVLFLANGASGVQVEGAESLAAFGQALDQICVELAHMIVRDGEGVSKFVTVRVSGARTEAEAHTIVNTIATSPLVKTAFAGSDPNWGRILMAAGRAGVPLDQNRLALWIGEGDPTTLQLVADGTPLGYTEADAAAIFAQPEFEVHLDLGLGDAAATVWTCDLTHDYVTINADYRT